MRIFSEEPSLNNNLSESKLFCFVFFFPCSYYLEQFAHRSVSHRHSTDFQILFNIAVVGWIRSLSKICWSPNTGHLWIQPHLESGSFQMQIALTLGQLVPNPMTDIRKKGHTHMGECQVEMEAETGASPWHKWITYDCWQVLEARRKAQKGCSEAPQKNQSYQNLYSEILSSRTLNK